MNDSAVFGPMTDDEDVQAAVLATVKKWLPTYLALIERKKDLDPKSLPLPRSYVLSDDGSLNKKPEDQLPAVVILTPGSGRQDPVRDGNGVYRAGFVVSLSVIVSAGGEDPHAATSALAKRYRKALELLILHHGSLDGFAEASLFQGWSNNDLRPEDDRSIAAGLNLFEVLVKGIAQHGAGLSEPLKEPYEEEAELPTITEVDVDIEPEGP